MNEPELREAVALLRDEQLVWSEDFEVIRVPLAGLLAKIAQLPTHQLDEELDAFLRPLLSFEHEVTEPNDPLESWVQKSARDLGIYKQLSDASPEFKTAITKLFGIL